MFSFLTSSYKRRHSSVRDKSATMVLIFPFGNISHKAFNLSLLLATTITLSPREMKIFAISRPIPLEAPVINTFIFDHFLQIVKQYNKELLKLPYKANVKARSIRYRL